MVTQYCGYNEIFILLHKIFEKQFWNLFISFKMKVKKQCWNWLWVRLKDYSCYPSWTHPRDLHFKVSGYCSLPGDSSAVIFTVIFPSKATWSFFLALLAHLRFFWSHKPCGESPFFFFLFLTRKPWNSASGCSWKWNLAPSLVWSP